MLGNLGISCSFHGQLWIVKVIVGIIKVRKECSMIVGLCLGYMMQS